jgi:putative DNA primase/helicase
MNAPFGGQYSRIRDSPRADGRSTSGAKSKRKDDFATISEQAVALQFVESWKGSAYFDHNRGAWFLWNDKSRFVQDKIGRAKHLCGISAQAAADLSDDKSKPRIRKWAFVTGVENFARVNPTMACLSDKWDPEAHILGVPSGCIDLSKESGIEAAPKNRFITRSTSVDPDFSMPTPLFDEFLDQITLSDKPLARFLQVWAGYCCTGETREEKLAFLYGSTGGNGKGTFVKTISYLLGSYADSTDMRTLAGEQFEDHPQALASLEGLRFVSASEPDAGTQWREGRLKQLTGRDPVKARFMRQAEFEYYPRLKLTLMGNDIPNLTKMDGPMRRRFLIVPFMYQPETANDRLLEQLRKEGPGILAWMIRGARAWYDEGLKIPPKVLTASEDYFEAQDIIGRWLEDCCEVDKANPDLVESSTALLQSFNGWAKRNTAAPMTSHTFVAQLKNKGFSHSKRRCGPTGKPLFSFTGTRLIYQHKRTNDYEH